MKHRLASKLRWIGYFRYEDEDGHRHTVYAFVYLLSFSRFVHVEFTERMDQDTLLMCLVNAFEASGGVPREVLFDNMKQAVLGRSPRGEVEWHPRLADFAMVVGFRPRACRPGRAQTKGKVERLIRYVRENFWPGRRFTDLADLNEQARAWCDKANRRVHGTTSQIPVEQLAKEALQPVPERERLEHLVGETRKVSRDGFVSFGGCRYGVPWSWAGAQVVVKERGPYVEIWSAAGDHLIHRHPRSLIPGSIIRIPEQYTGLPLTGPVHSLEPVARRISAPEVEVRPLAVYEAMAGGEAP
ncbi:MAG: IS21 family transposase [Clostridiales bacterium]|nr:IS21 family transposase [Clostridiales bacterium]